MSQNLIIEILSTDVNTRSGTSQNGAPYSISTQKMYFHNGEAFPEGFDISLDIEGGQSAFPVGKYLLGQGSVRRGKYGPEFARSLSLVPIASQQKAS